jgi:hypothetical protein
MFTNLDVDTIHCVASGFKNLEGPNRIISLAIIERIYVQQTKISSFDVDRSACRAALQMGRVRSICSAR